MNTYWKQTFWLLFLSAIVLTALTTTTAGAGRAADIAATAEARSLARYGDLPLAFEANAGQMNAQVDFLSQGEGYRLFLTPTQAAVMVNGRQPSTSPPAAKHGSKSVVQPAAMVALQMDIIGADPAVRGQGVKKLAGRRNYLIGKSPKKWKTDIPTYAKVRYPNIYKDIDLVYYGNGRQLEYDFVVGPGASVDRIRLGFDQGHHLRIDKEGNLVISITAQDEMMFKAPICYQWINGDKKTVTGNYSLKAKKGKNHRWEVTFNVGRYDAAHPLVIDPVLSFSTRLGGSGQDEAMAIALDPRGPVGDRAYITGYTTTADFPGTGIGGGLGYQSTQNVFVAKLNADGTALEYGTYIGGVAGYNGTANIEAGTGIAVDGDGCAYVTGYTNSTDFPTASGEFDTYAGGDYDAFVLKLNADGNALEYSTYLGGNSDDRGYDIDVYDMPATGWSAYVVGKTESSNFPETYSTEWAPSAFAARLYTTSGYFDWIRTIGASGFAAGIDVDDNGNAYIAGYTNGSLPTTDGAYQATIPSAYMDGYVAKLTPDGDMDYCTYLGGSYYDEAHDIAVDGDGNALVVGTTRSGNFPTTDNAFQPDLAPCPESNVDAFVVKLNPTGTDLIYGSFLGGMGFEEGSGIDVDACGNAYVVGRTQDIGMPECPDVFPQINAPSGAGDCTDDAFVTKINAAGTAMIYSACLGGSETDDAKGVAVVNTDAFVAGMTNSPASEFAQTNLGLGGYSEAFVTRIRSAGNSIGFFDLSFTASEGDGSATITVSRYGGSDGAVTADYTTSAGTATPVDDYTETQGTLSWTDGDAQDKTFTIPLVDDALPEDEETVYVTLTALTGNVELNCAVSVPLTILDNDTNSPGTIGFTADDYEVDEDAGNAVITVSRTNGSTGTVTIDYSIDDGTATAPDDYTVVSGTLTWTHGDTANKTFSVPIIADSVLDYNENVNLRLSNPSVAGTLDTLHDYATLHIRDTPPVEGYIEFSSDDYETDEDDNFVLITVNRVGGSEGAATVDYATQDDTAVAPDDYNAASGTLSWDDGEDGGKTITVPINTDNEIEVDETFQVVLSNPTGSAIIRESTADVIIADTTETEAGIIQFEETDYSVNENAAQITVCAERIEGSSGDVEVTYECTDGTADAADYTCPSEPLSWSDGSTTRACITIDITSENDCLEGGGNEDFTITLGTPTSGTLRGINHTADITIRDNNPCGSGSDDTWCFINTLIE